ncbi:gp16 family protein [Enterobacter ludwigii]|uniref:gp16 family protein n=1 Tax=Enterobacter ludwigii TaxID=299767 RepID=UPI0013D18B15|nr:regulatory protein GemA [Enterobacter ludwigii]
MANLIKVIHTGKKSLGWDDETYRAVLARVTGKRSARDCSESELESVVLYMRSQGFAFVANHGRRPKVSCAKKAMLGKIEALLAESGRAWTYVESIAKRMFKQEKLEWLTVEQMRALMNALQYDAKRHGRRS